MRKVTGKSKVKEFPGSQNVRAKSQSYKGLSSGENSAGKSLTPAERPDIPTWGTLSVISELFALDTFFLVHQIKFY
jgi:hypothetical protein